MESNLIMNIYKLEVTRSVPFEGEYTIGAFEVLYFKSIDRALNKFKHYVDIVRENYKDFKITNYQDGYCLFEDKYGGSICVSISIHELF